MNVPHKKNRQPPRPFPPDSSWVLSRVGRPSHQTPSSKFDGNFTQAVRFGDTLALAQFTKRIRMKAKRNLQTWIGHVPAPIPTLIKSAWLSLITQNRVRRICRNPSILNDSMAFDWVMVYVQLNLLRRLLENPFRNEQSLLTQTAIKAASYAMEGQFIALLDLAPLLHQLKRFDAVAYETLWAKFGEGATLQEIAEEKNRTIQKVRTSLKKAIAFIRKQDAHRRLGSIL